MLTARPCLGLILQAILVHIYTNSTLSTSYLKTLSEFIYYKPIASSFIKYVEHKTFEVLKTLKTLKNESDRTHRTGRSLFCEVNFAHRKL